jgi:hypothetical protein
MVNSLLTRTVSSCWLLFTLSLKVGFRVLMTPTNHGLLLVKQPQNKEERESRCVVICWSTFTEPTRTGSCRIAHCRRYLSDCQTRPCPTITSAHASRMRRPKKKDLVTSRTRLHLHPPGVEPPAPAPTPEASPAAGRQGWQVVLRSGDGFAKRRRRRRRLRPYVWRATTTIKGCTNRRLVSCIVDFFWSTLPHLSLCI